MKRRRCTSACLYISCIFVIFGLAGILGGVFGHVWWIHDLGGKFENGILRYNHVYSSGTEQSGFIDNIFKFKKSRSSVTGINNEQRDTILLCLVISSIFAIFSLLSMFCGSFRMGESSWDISTTLTAFFTSMSAIPAIGAMIYVEVKLDNTWKELSDRNKCWSYMLAWIGTGFLFLSAIFSFGLICMKPRVGYTINSVPSKSNITMVAKSNNAFDSEIGIDEPIRTIIVKKGRTKPVGIIESAA